MYELNFTTGQLLLLFSFDSAENVRENYLLVLGVGTGSLLTHYQMIGKILQNVIREGGGQDNTQIYLASFIMLYCFFFYNLSKVL